jgi:hypothetical protein
MGVVLGSTPIDDEQRDQDPDYRDHDQEDDPSALWILEHRGNLATSLAGRRVLLPTPVREKSQDLVLALDQRRKQTTLCMTSSAGRGKASAEGLHTRQCDVRI